MSLDAADESEDPCKILREGTCAVNLAQFAEAESEKLARLGLGQAIAIEEQVRAYGGLQFQLTQQVLGRFAEAVQASGVDLVPKIVIGAGGGNGNGPKTAGGSVLEALLTMLLSEKLGQGVTAPAARDPEAESLKRELRARLLRKAKTAEA